VASRSLAQDGGCRDEALDNFDRLSGRDPCVRGASLAHWIANQRDRKQYKDEPLYGLGCQESVRDFVPFFLALLNRFLVGSRGRVPRRPRQCQLAAQTGVDEVTRIETAFGLRVRFSLVVTSGRAVRRRDALKPRFDVKRSAVHFQRQCRGRHCGNRDRDKSRRR